MRISDWSSDVCSSDLLVIASEPSAFCTSQAQPEPKVPTAVSVNCFLKSSTPPNCLTKASVNFLPGAPCFGVRQFQKKLWFQTCAALLKILPDDFLMMSSIDMFSNSVPAISLLPLRSEERRVGKGGVS